MKKNKRGKKWLSGWERLKRRRWARGVPARYPSTEESRRWNAALWSQPHAVPSNLGTTSPNPSVGSHGSTPHLERASQWLNPISPYLSSQTNLQPPWCPHLSHKPTLPGPAVFVLNWSPFKQIIFHIVFRCGTPGELFTQMHNKRRKISLGRFNSINNHIQWLLDKHLLC